MCHLSGTAWRRGKFFATVRVAPASTGHTEFHDRFPWGQLANFACQYLGKGRLIGIEGQLLARKLQNTDHPVPDALSLTLIGSERSARREHPAT